MASACQPLFVVVPIQLGPVLKCELPFWVDCVCLKWFQLVPRLVTTLMMIDGLRDLVNSAVNNVNNII